MDSASVAVFASQPITPTDDPNMLIAAILSKCVFQLEYIKWHALSAGERALFDT